MIGAWVIMAIGSERPSGVLRVLLRIPIWLYRLGLGRLLDHRLLLIMHRGRKSGLLREAVVEVVRWDKQTGECVVMAGWRGTTDWYRNITAEPALEIRIGGDRYVPRQRFLSPVETATELRAYVDKHPWVARKVLANAFGFHLDGTEASWRAAVEFFHGVEFTPRR
jgi:deazaflavin-dependent oxidoreductase (nitroreductase family)